jgi:hypothetical protein
VVGVDGRHGDAGAAEPVIFETAGLDDWMVDKAYDEFNKMLVELVGSDTTWVGPPDDLELLGLHFSDIPG